MKTCNNFFCILRVVLNTILGFRFGSIKSTTGGRKNRLCARYFSYFRAFTWVYIRRVAILLGVLVCTPGLLRSMRTTRLSQARPLTRYKTWRVRVKGWPLLALVLPNALLPPGLIVKRLQPVRRGVSSSLIFPLVLTVLIVYLYQSQSQPQSQSVPLTYDDRVATRVSQLHATATADALATLASAAPTVTPPVQVTPSLAPMLTPTLTPTPTYTPTSTSYSVYRYSYYNPALGGINCLLWDDAAQTCQSPMASGDDWRAWYGRAVACPPDIALGTVVRVHYPPVLAGDWVCLDRGGAIVGDILDFLDLSQRYNWLGTVVVTLLPPQEPLIPLHRGTH